MVLFRYFVILIFFHFLDENINLVQCLPEKCQFDSRHSSLDCSNRKLTTIPQDIFSSVEYAQIKLVNNPFVCDCGILWFLDSIQNIKNSDRIIDLETLKCDSPIHLRSQYLVELTREDVCTEMPELISLKVKRSAEGIPTKKRRVKVAGPDPCKSESGFAKCDPNTEVCVRNGTAHDCKCKNGFRRKGDQDQCVVFNACHENIHCSKHAQCINEIGSYKCICKSGYIGDGKQCKDKNECEDRKSNDCHKYAFCINENGGYRCQCRKGFEQRDEGRVCSKKSTVPTQTLLMAGLIAGIPFVMFIALTIYLCKRRIHRKQATQVEYSPANNDDVIMPGDLNQMQPLMPAMDSYYEDSIPMKGLPPSESAWSEWPDYDDTRESDSD